MSAIEDRYEYLNNPFFKKAEYGDFTPFYVTITICTVLAAILFIINIVLGCCSRHSDYWNERHTGNRWLIPLWTSSPHKQPPLDLTEIDQEYISSPPPKHQETVYLPQQQYTELQKRESDL